MGQFMERKPVPRGREDRWYYEETKIISPFIRNHPASCRMRRKGKSGNRRAECGDRNADGFRGFGRYF